MNFTMETLAKSLANYLAPAFPGVQFLEDPAQQGITPPCMFIQQRNSQISRQIGGYFLRRIGVDLVYLLPYNLANLQRQYQEAAETLDLSLDSFDYSDGEESAPLWTLERHWTIDKDELHYMFDVEIRVSLPEDFNPMRTMTQTETVTEGDVQ